MFSHHNGSGSCGLLTASDSFKGCFRPGLVSPDVISPSTNYSASAKDRNCMEMKGKVLPNVWDPTSGPSSSAASRFSLPAPPPQFYFDTKYSATRSIRASSFQLYHSKGFKVTVPEDDASATAASPSTDLHPHHAKYQRMGHQQPDSPFRSLRQGARLHKTSFLADGRYYPSGGMSADDPTRRSGAHNPGIYPYMRLGSGRPSANRSFFRALNPRPLLPTDRWPLHPPPPGPPPHPQQHFEGLWMHPPTQKLFYSSCSSSVNTDQFHLMTSSSSAASANDKSVSPSSHHASLDTLLTRRTLLQQRGQPNSKDPGGGTGKTSSSLFRSSDLLLPLRPIPKDVQSDSLQTPSAIASLSYLCSGLSSDKHSPTAEPTKGLLLRSGSHSPSNGPTGFDVRSPLPVTFPAATSSTSETHSSSSFFFFTRGSLIQLADGTLKRVEDLDTNDFFRNTGLDGSMKMDLSKVEDIRRMEGTGEAVLCFRVGPKQTRVTFRVPMSHPFFVCNRGWSSCDPVRTRATYGLDCHPLSPGDPCVSLTQMIPQRSPSSSPATHPPPPHPQATPRTTSSATTTLQPSEYSSQHHTSLWQPHLAAAAATTTEDEDEEEDEDDENEEEERLSSSTAACVDVESTPAAGSSATELKTTVAVEAEAEEEEEEEINVDKEDDDDENARTIPVAATGRGDGVTPGD